MELSKKDNIDNLLNESFYSLKDYIMNKEVSLVKKNKERFKQLNSNYNKYVKNLKYWYIPKNLKCDYDILIKLLDKAEKEIKYIEHSEFKNILKVYYNDNLACKEIAYLHFKCNNDLYKLVNIQKELNNHIICIGENIDIGLLKRDVNKLIRKFQNRNKKVVKILATFDKGSVSECRVDFQYIDSLEKAIVIKNYIKGKDTFESIKFNWNTIMKKYNGPQISLDSNINLIYLEDLINKLGIIVNWNSVYKSNIFKLLKKIRIDQKINWYNSESYSYLIKCIYSIKYIEEYKNLKAYIQVLQKVNLSY